MTSSESAALDARIIYLRQHDRMTCKEVAARLHIREWRVWTCMQRHGMSRKGNHIALKPKVHICESATGQITPRDQAMLDDAELMDVEDWIRDVREERRPREARIPENYMRRMELLITIARRRG